jgi:RNA polymerase sigma factor (sigma-70 family)
MKSIEKFSDKEIVDGILIQDEQIVRYFFFEKCIPLFISINSDIFNGHAEPNELINMLYLYLYENNWHRLRSFDGQKSKLITWISKVARRFFAKKLAEMMKKKNEKNTYMQNKLHEEDEQAEQELEPKPKLDVETVKSSLSNERYCEVIRRVVIKDEDPQKVADKMGVTVDNLYNIKARALKKLKRIIINSRENIRLHGYW